MPAAVLDARAAGEHLHALTLPRVRVQPRPVAVRFEDELDDGCATVCLRRRGAEDEPGAALRVLDRVAGADHGPSTLERRP